MTEWMDQLTQAATRLAAERHRDIAFLRSTAAAGATDPVVRARLEREAAEATATADGYAARAAELAVGNEPWEEAEIAQQVEQARVAATHDVLDDPGETTEQLRQREIADATMRSYLAWQQEGVPPQEIAHRLERVSPIGAKAVSDYEQLLTVGYTPDEARAIAADTAAQDPIPPDRTVADEVGEDLFEPDVPDPVDEEAAQLAFDRAYTVGEEAIDLFKNVLCEANSEADARAETLRMFEGDSLAVAQAALDLYTARRGAEDEPLDLAELAATTAAEQATAQDTGEESTVGTNEPGTSAQAEAAAARLRNDEATYEADVEQRYQALLRDGVDMVTALRRAEDGARENWQLEPWSAQGRTVDHAHAVVADNGADVAPMRGDVEPGSQPPVAMHSLSARFLRAGDGFEWNGKVYVADDDAIEHDGVVTVPLELSNGANGWVDVPATEMVPLHHDDISYEIDENDHGESTASEVDLAETARAERDDALGTAEQPERWENEPTAQDFAEDARRNYGIAAAAVNRFVRLKDEGLSDDAAEVQAIDSCEDGIEVAADTIVVYRRERDAGTTHKAAHNTAVADIVGHHTPLWNIEEAQRFVADIDGPDNTAAADAVDEAVSSASTESNPTASASGSSTPVASVGVTGVVANVSPPGVLYSEDGAWQDVAVEAWELNARKAGHIVEATEWDTSGDGVIARVQVDGQWHELCSDTQSPGQVFAVAAESDAAQDDAPEPGGWIARNLPARDGNVSGDLPEMDLRTALDLVAVHSRVEEDNPALTARDAAAMARELDVEDIYGGVDEPTARAAYLTVLNAFDADIDEALAQESIAPSGDGQASEWPVVEQDETSHVAADTDDVVARIDQVLHEDADGDLSEEDAEEQYIEQRRASVRAELAAAAEGMTVEDARALVREADGIEEHLSSCGQDVSQCGTCSQQEHDTGDFWSVDVPAARQRLANTPLVGRVAECGRAVEEVEDAVQQHDPTDEDAERAERCARWNAEDAAEQTADDTEGWGQ
ncbi:hypothetical protein LCL61_08750 [Amycolatopsis coloradensis]|uniref:Uncharacterized protein n=1 Tax=Amycolatopsis coloradensis TaxID=76021 RepID=A0ACD5B8Q1_9PSEU